MESINSLSLKILWSPPLKILLLAVSTIPQLLYHDPYLTVIKHLFWKTHPKSNLQFSIKSVLAFSLQNTAKAFLGGVLLYAISSTCLTTDCIGGIWGATCKMHI